MRVAWICGITALVTVAGVRIVKHHSHNSVEDIDGLDTSVAHGVQDVDSAAVASSRRRRARRRSSSPRRRASSPPRRRGSSSPSPGGPAPSPPGGSGCTRLIIFGDYGKRTSGQKEVAAGLAKVADSFKPEFFIAVGDNIYASKGTKEHFKQTWFDYYMKYPSLQKKWYSCQGNHDWTHDATFILDFSKSSMNKGSYWDTPAFWYKKSKRNLDFFFVDTMVEMKASNAGKKFGSSGQAKQRSWLDSEMKKSNAAWKIVVGHHPFATWESNGPKTKNGLKGLTSIAEKHKVSAFFVGHLHHLQMVRVNGWYHVLSGGGAYGTQNSEKSPNVGKGLIGYWPGGGLMTFATCDSRTADIGIYGGKGNYKRTVKITSSGSRSATLDNAEDVEEDPQEYECGGVQLADVDRPCSRADPCTVAVDRDQDETCETYCAEHGLACTGGWSQDQEIPDGCSLFETLGCNGTTGRSQDNHVCQCAPVVD